MRDICRMLSLLPILVMAACGGTQWSDVKSTLPAVPQDKARLVIFRQSHFGGSAVRVNISINDTVIGSISNGSVLRVDHAPGNLDIYVDPETPLGLSAIDRMFGAPKGFDDFLTVDGGHTYYIELGGWPNCDPDRIGGLAACGMEATSMTKSDNCNFSLHWCVGVRDESVALPKLDGLSVVKANGE
jgi:hypothetical protein